MPIPQQVRHLGPHFLERGCAVFFTFFGNWVHRGPTTKVKGHRLFSGQVFKGKYETLEAALHVVGHVAAYQLR